MVRLLDTRTVTANRAWVRDELIADDVPVADADAWCVAWESEARRIGLDPRLSDFWTLGSVWIREHLRHPR